MFARLARVATVIVMIAYPVVVYVGMTRTSIRTTALALLGLSITLALLRASNLNLAGLREAFQPLAPTLVAAAVSAISGRAGLLLWVPVFVNLGLLLSFGSTLREGVTPMIERFARLQHADLPPRGVAWCRGVTKVWVGFFAVNALVSAILAIAAPFEWWATYCGGIAYGLVGALMAGEWILRRIRMGAPEAAP